MYRRQLWPHWPRNTRAHSVDLIKGETLALEVLVEDVAQSESRDKDLPDDGRNNFGHDRHLGI